MFRDTMYDFGLKLIEDFYGLRFYGLRFEDLYGISPFFSSFLGS